MAFSLTYTDLIKYVFHSGSDKVGPIDCECL